MFMGTNEEVPSAISYLEKIGGKTKAQRDAEEAKRLADIEAKNARYAEVFRARQGPEGSVYSGGASIGVHVGGSSDASSPRRPSTKDPRSNNEIARDEQESRRARNRWHPTDDMSTVE